MRSTLIALLALCSSIGIGCSRHEGQPAARAAAGSLVQTDHLTFEMPTAWQQTPASSKMRIAQATIPGPGGNADLAVFYFGAGQGGGTEANIQRWIGQVEPSANGSPERREFDANDLHVTWVDVEGTLKSGQMGMGPATEQSNAMLLGAVVEGPSGPWFFKATGPRDTLAAQRDAFVAMLKSARPK